MYCPTTKELGRRWRQSIVRAAGAAEKSKPELSPIHLTFSSSWSQSSKKIRLRIARFDVASGVRERLTDICDSLYLLWFAVVAESVRIFDVGLAPVCQR